MRISELLTATVVDETGRSVGRVRDVRITRQPTPAGEGEPPPFRIAGLVLGGGRLAHAWGFAEGRASGPWLFRVLTARAARKARFLPAEQVETWDPQGVTMRGRLEDLPLLADELRR